MQLGELRVAMASLGFKAKHVRSVFTVLVTILLLSNLTFTDDRATGSLGMTSMDERARVEDRVLLGVIAGHLGVSPDDLEAVLVNRTKWVRRDLCSMFLDARGAEMQRDSLMRDLYAILFTFVVEMANKRLAPPNDAAPELQIVQLDIPGYQSRTISDDTTGLGAGAGSRPGSMMGMVPLVNASGQNGFQEYSVNFMNEVVHSYLSRRAFEDDMPGSVGPLSDGLRIPEVSITGNTACVELLRGGLLGSSKLARKAGGVAGVLAIASEELKGEERDEEKAERLVEDLNATFGRHGSYIVNPSLGLGPLSTERHMFGINHYSGSCSYDATDFVDGNADVLDKQLVDLLRGSADSFISKLVSGPGLATEGHPLDSDITVEAQVSVGPMRVPTGIINPLVGTNPGKVVTDWPVDLNIPQPVVSQLNACLSTMLDTMDKTRVWNVACIRPNDSGHPNSFDKRRVKAQLRSMMIAELIQRKQADWVVDYGLEEFCRRHDLRSEQPGEEVHAFGESRGWVRGVDYEIGRERVWFGWNAWKDQEDLIRAGETRRGSGEETLADLDDARTPEARYGGLGAGRPDVGESSEDLLLKKRGDDEYAPNTPGEGYGYRDRDTPDYNASQVWSEYPTKETPIYDSTIPALEKDSKGKNDMIVREKKHVATEVIATTSARRWWLRLVWLLTWWIPSFCLSRVGKMDRADIRLAWREKVAIVMMIGFLCGVVIFYIVVFGMLLCPNSAKAWNVSELAEHAGTSDYYAAIAGKVYDVSLPRRFA
jgi:chitin synthase